MDMGKCTSCILYIKQNPTTYKETTISQRNGTLIAAFLLESSTTNQSIPNNIIYSLPTPFSPQKKKKKNGHQQSPRFNLTCTSRACSLKVLPK
jgi:hypothetical protein